MTTESTLEGYSTVTLEILAAIDNFVEKIKDSMVLGEDGILKGINYFKDALKEVNPIIVNDETVLMVKELADRNILEDEERMQHVNNSARLGILQCGLIMNGYVKRKKRELVKI